MTHFVLQDQPCRTTHSQDQPHTQAQHVIDEVMKFEINFCSFLSQLGQKGRKVVCLRCALKRAKPHGVLVKSRTAYGIRSTRVNAARIGRGVVNAACALGALGRTVLVSSAGSHGLPLLHLSFLQGTP